MNNKKRLLIVDDEPNVLNQMKWGISKEGYDLSFAKTLEESRGIFRKIRPQVVTLDLNLDSSCEENEEGFVLLQEFIELYPTTKVIMITGKDERENSHKALKLGAYDFYNKPVDIENLKVILKRAFYLHEIEEEINMLQEQVFDVSFNGIIGKTKEIQAVLSLVKRVAATDVSALVLGESGTGKELVARAIHNFSSRKKAPFVAINCSAIPEALIEAELFGHEKGSFTGAVCQKIGKVETAQNGTIFLDEIGDMPLSMQVKLLRFLQERELERVGGGKPIKLNIRVIAATNRDLKKDIEKKVFREDLYYRLNVVPITLPPLRERKGDILFIAAAFLKKFNKEYGKDVKGYSNDAVDAMKNYSWPGNIRELENNVRRGIVVTKGKFITVADLGLEGIDISSNDDVENETFKSFREKTDKEFIIKHLKENCGNISKTAKLIDISRPTFHDMLKKYQINAEEFKKK